MSANVKAQVEDATEASLNEDAMLQVRVAALVRQCIDDAQRKARCSIPPILKHNDKAATAQETLAYWRKAGECSALVRIFQPMLEAGAQPVFAAISLRVSSNDPTVVVPVPYLTPGRGAARIRDHFWINPEECGAAAFRPSRQDTECAIREVSHALTNISYSVRLDDEPKVGWLSRAHTEGTPLYFPNVSGLADERLNARGRKRLPQGYVHSAASREEPYLGMASVLYIPLLDPDAKPQAARAVLMLWSPVPGRWDGCFKSTAPALGGSALEVRDLSSREMRRHIWDHFHWLEYAAAKDDTTLHRAELQILNFMSVMLRWHDGQTENVRSAFSEFFHGSSALLDHFKDAPYDHTTRVVDWIDELLHGGSGFQYLLRRRWQKAKISEDLDHLPIKLRLPNGQIKTFKLNETPEVGVLAPYVDKNAKILLADYTATYIGGEPVDNIAKYAEALEGITITLSEKFISLRFLERPILRHMQRLVGSDRSFRRYYAIRRGLAISPPVSRSGRALGHGLGYWLFRVFAARTKVWRKLYVSADGKVCHTDLVVPLAP